MPFRGREIRSTVDADGQLTLSIEEVAIADPSDDEVVVRVEAAPINPSDIALMLGSADVSTMEKIGRDEPSLTFTVPPERRKALTRRIGQSLALGNEGAGTVVAAGRNVAALNGKVVGIRGGVFAEYRKLRAQDAAVLPDGITPVQGASFANPLTALGFIETARSGGHKAIIHTAAASNLGQMLQKVCLTEGIPLINIVRSQAHVDLLRGIGASSVLNSQDDDFVDQLSVAIAELEATVAFDAVGGGVLGSNILHAMERAATSDTSVYSRYGSDTFKQLYVYGTLDSGPTTLDRFGLGYQWSVSGWLITPFLQRLGHEGASRLRQRVANEITTTFASRYARTIGLAEALQPDVLRAYERRSTGEKFLIDPTRA